MYAKQLISFLHSDRPKTNNPDKKRAYKMRVNSQEKKRSHKAFKHETTSTLHVIFTLQIPNETPPCTRQTGNPQSLGVLQAAAAGSAGRRWQWRPAGLRQAQQARAVRTRLATARTLRTPFGNPSSAQIHMYAHRPTATKTQNN